MGKRLQRAFEEAGTLGGLVARMRLASMAQLTSMEAETLEDRPDVVQRVQTALDEIRKQFAGGDRDDKAAPSAVAATGGGDEQSKVLRRHLNAYLDMMSQRSLFLGNVDATIRRVNEAASSAIDVERVSVWYCDAQQTKIWCVDMFQRAQATHSGGTELFAKDFAPYFRALRAERTIAAHDAHSDARTSCFTEVYLKPLGIGALLDVPIWVGRSMVGVVCHEHVGPKRNWTKDEETFAYLMSNFVALALERGSTDSAPRTVRRTAGAGGSTP
jgi:GAF domain-containing protein